MSATAQHLRPTFDFPQLRSCLGDGDQGWCKIKDTRIGKRLQEMEGFREKFADMLCFNKRWRKTHTENNGREGIRRFRRQEVKDFVWKWVVRGKYIIFAPTVDYEERLNQWWRDQWNDEIILPPWSSSPPLPPNGRFPLIPQKHHGADNTIYPSTPPPTQHSLHPTLPSSLSCLRLS